MNSFIYNVPTKIYFGEGQLKNLGGEVANYGKKVLLCYGGGTIKKIGLYDRVIRELKKHELDVFELSGIEPNPRINSVRDGAKLCKLLGIDVVLAVGGGSVIDCAKYVAAGACYSGDAWDFFEYTATPEKALPVISVLTLSATGSEMDCGGVITNPDIKEKIGRMCPPLLPKVSFLDPTLTYTVNAYQTACGSADIFSHILETYFSPTEDLSMLDDIAESLLKTVIKYAPIAMVEPTNYDARANLMWASSWAINGFLTGGKTHAWSCHPIEHELSAYYDITHGLGLAIVTPRWMWYTLNSKTAKRFEKYGVNVWGINPKLPQREICELAIKRTERFFYASLRLTPTLSELGIDSKYFGIMSRKACKNLSRGFQPLKSDDVLHILKMCL